MDPSLVVKHLTTDVAFEMLDLDPEPSFDMVNSNQSAEESPLPVPSYNPQISNSSDSSAQLVILDPSPPSSPEASATPRQFHGYEYTTDSLAFDLDSIAVDLEHVLSFKESDYKMVKFQETPPRRLQYVVSMDLDPDSLRSVQPKGTHSALLHVPQSDASPQELMDSSELLQSAASRNTVKTQRIKIESRTRCKGFPDIDCHDENEEEQKVESPSAAEQLISLHNSSDETLKKTADGDITSPRTKQLIALYIEQDLSLNGFQVKFDRISVTASNEKTVLLDSRGFNSGYHEWSVQVWRCDVDLQEIGVIGTRDIDTIPVSDHGAFETAAFQSRAAYGCEMSTGLLYYGSCNANGKKRCHRDLRPFFNVGWTVGDVVTVKLDLDKWRIKYLLNGKAVRYTMSLEPNKTYFPMICFSGNCRYFMH